MIDQVLIDAHVARHHVRVSDRQRVLIVAGLTSALASQRLVEGPRSHAKRSVERPGNLAKKSHGAHGETAACRSSIRPTASAAC